MGNYDQLKQSVSAVIKTNGNQEITGSILQNVLLTIISTVGANATFAGIATPATNPGTPDGPVFYLASESGTYTNFNAIKLQDGLSVLLWNGSWSIKQIFSVDNEPTAGSDNLVKSGGVHDSLLDTRKELQEELNRAVESITPIKITGNVTNAPDEEDLTSVNVGGTDVLKFKDKAYNPLTYSGMGRKILRKNIVDGVNTLTQSMMSDANTIYIIQYDFTLGEDITVPANCILEFDGGSLSNGSCICQNTRIEGTPKFINISNIGTVAENYIDLSWFELSDYTPLLQNFVNATDGTNAVVFIPAGTYVITSLEVKTSSESALSNKATFTIKGNGVSSIIDINGGSGIKLFRKSLVENLSIRGSSNNYALRIGGDPAIYGHTIQGTRISWVDFRNNSGGALYGVDWLINLTIEKCYFTNNGNSDKYVCYIAGNHSTTVAIDRCYFSNNGNCKCALYISAAIGYTYITRSIFESSNRLIQAYAGSLSVEDCFFECVTDYAIFASNYTVDVIVRSCEFKYQKINRKAYIYLYNSGVTLIENNSFGALYLGESENADSISGPNINNAVYINNVFSDSHDITPYRIYQNKAGVIKNLVKNSSFKDAYTATSYFERVDTEGCFDNYCMRFHSSEQAVKDCSAVVLPLTANKRYVLSFYAKQNGENVSNPVHLVVTGTFEAGEMNFRPEPNWKRYVYAFTPTSSANLYMYFSSLVPLASVDILIDDVQLEQLDEGTASEYVMTTNASITNYLGRLPVLGGSVRPVNPTKGDMFFDATIGTNGKPIWWNGTAWVDNIGVVAGTPTSGTFANKPTVATNNIPIGFKYFCTDKQTVEGATDGIEIIHKGNDIWVDALGRVVS